MNRWRVLVVALLVGTGSPARAIPFTACSFYDSRLADESWDSCASPNVGGLGSCWICPLGLCHPAFQVDLWTPEWFVEVTNRSGESAFATLDAPALKASFDAGNAVSGWSESSVAAWTSEHWQQNSERSLYFGRVVATGWGPIGWTFPTIGIGPDVGTPVMPQCFAAVSEWAPSTWANKPGTADSVIAAIWAPVTAPMCGIGGAITTVPGTLNQYAPKPFVVPTGCMSTGNGCYACPQGEGNYQQFCEPQPPKPVPCAVPLGNVPGAEATLAFSSPTMTDPTRQCMGALGGLYPRTGIVDGDVFVAAQRVAWRTTSITEDLFNSTAQPSPHGDDKWQMVWPDATSHRCFTPGSLTRPGPMDFLKRGPGYDASGSEKNTEFVFAVWRKRSVCLEWGQNFAVQAELLGHKELAKIACGPLNLVNQP